MSRAPQGFRVQTASLGVKDTTADFCVVVSDRPAVAAGVYTQSRFAGPSVSISRAVTSSGGAQGVTVISKNANVANGSVGDRDAADLQHAVAEHVGIAPASLVVASTGVIGRRYPMDRIRSGIATVAWPPEPATYTDFAAAATAIMTTDTHPKIVSAVMPTRSGGEAVVLGIAKGVGMIEPNMATLLTFFFTDAEVAPDTLDGVFRSTMDVTFNALSIDTDTSTSDTGVVLANGEAGAVDEHEFRAALHRVALDLVLMIAADGEGASKVIEVDVRGARDNAQARLVAKAIVNSPLVKTAVHGADPNWGRIVMAIGKCDDQEDIDADKVVVRIGGIEMYPDVADDGALAAAAKHLAGDRALISVDLSIAQGSFTAYGCDLTDGYIRINADYTT